MDVGLYPNKYGWSSVHGTKLSLPHTLPPSPRKAVSRSQAAFQKTCKVELRLQWAKEVTSGDQGTFLVWDSEVSHVQEALWSQANAFPCKSRDCKYPHGFC